MGDNLNNSTTQPNQQNIINENNKQEVTTFLNNYENFLNEYVFNPVVIIVIIIVIILYYIIMYYLGNSKANDSLGYSNNSFDSNLNNINQGVSHFITGLIIFIVILLIIFYIFNYYFKLNFPLLNNLNEYILHFSGISNSSQGKMNSPNVLTSINSKLSFTYPYKGSSTSNTSNVPEIKTFKQVFNIPGNKYGYKEAKELCNAYGAKLANYEQIENAYNNGGEWCNYGWSDGQMILYPTQMKTYNNLQKISGHEHDCGRPGINGGYIANPEVKFGVNCFGYKPKITNVEQEMMNNTAPYPVSVQDQNLQNQVDYWKNKIDNILISPFNSKKWSEYI
jgi:hypothetical protein